MSFKELTKEELEKSMRNYASDDLPNLDKKGKPYLATEWDITLQFCPFCNELAYEDTHCVFCGAEFIKPTKEEIELRKEANHEITVSYKNITLHQCSNSVWYYKDGKVMAHAQFIGPQTEEQLLEIAKKYAGE